MSEYPTTPTNPPESPAAAPRSVQVSLPSGVPYATYTIVAVTVLVYLLQRASVFTLGYANAAAELDWLEYYGAQIPSAIRAGELWRFLTPMLLHASVPHILFNMYALVAFGAGLERSFGHWRFVLLYILGGFAGNVMSFLLASPQAYSVGASTAIFGLVGAEGVFLYQNRKMFGRQFGRAIGNVIFVVAVNLALGLTPGIDNWGHIGGLLGGLVFSWFAGPVWAVEGMYPALHVADQREVRGIVTGAALVVLIFGAVAVWGMLAPLKP